MTITRTVTLYDGPGGPFEGMAVADDSGGAQPGVLLLPNVLGTKEQDFARAERVAALGYRVLVADVYGQGKRTKRGEPDMGRYMAGLNTDRDLLKARLDASLQTLKGLAGVDAGRCAAIGFCFGGKCVLDMARAGLGVRGVVSFHGVYDAPPYAPVSPIAAKILVCHGWDDPIAPPDKTVALARELTDAGADWQIHAYGHTSHAFTDESVDMATHGMGYQPDADRRSWKAMADFLEEVLG
jgi:dienelactone hydrolase